MAIPETFTREFRTLSFSAKRDFISKNISYASDEAVADHVKSYYLDILDEMDDPCAIADWLRSKGYAVTANGKK